MAYRENCRFVALPINRSQVLSQSEDRPVRADASEGAIQGVSQLSVRDETQTSGVLVRRLIGRA